MPRKHKKVRSRRRPRRRHYKVRPRKAIPLGNRFKFTTRYVEDTLSINASAGTLAAFVFTANGLYDPNTTGVGHQPLGFDQLMTMYEHYTVIASKISVWFDNEDATNSQVVGIALSSTDSVLTDSREYIENGNVVWRCINKAGEDKSSIQLKKKCSVKNFLGRPNILSEDSCRGTVANNPTEQCYYHVFAASTTNVDPGIVRLFVTIDYIAILTEPKKLALS